MYLKLNLSLVPARMMDPSYICPRTILISMFSLYGFRGGEGVRVNPNIVKIVMHIGIYGRSLAYTEVQSIPSLYMLCFSESFKVSGYP